MEGDACLLCRVGGVHLRALPPPFIKAPAAASEQELRLHRAETRRPAASVLCAAKTNEGRHARFLPSQGSRGTDLRPIRPAGDAGGWWNHA